MKRLAQGLLIAGCVASVGFGLGFLGFLRVAGALPDAADRRSAGIVVLTGGADRVSTGLRLLREGRGDRMLISGVYPGTKLEDLAGGAEAGNLAAQVELGRHARSTRGNAREVAAWAHIHGLESIRVVTAGYHMPRALLELRRTLPGVELLPWQVTPPRLRQAGALAEARTWSLLVGEYLKLLLAWTGLPAAVAKLRTE